jgi:uncharacterized protein with NAD-binding domain and iron-sulfur cluster
LNLIDFSPDHPRDITIREAKIKEAGMRVAIVGAGLAGMAAAVDLVDAGHSVEIYEARPFVGGKVGSWVDKDGNHVEMGLHVFFGCYYNLFDLMRQVGAFDHLRLKEHTHTFVNRGGQLGALDFRFITGAPFNGLKGLFHYQSAVDPRQNPKFYCPGYQSCGERLSRFRWCDEIYPRLR